MIEDGEVRSEGCICEPCSDILPNWKDIRTKFGYKPLSEIAYRGRIMSKKDLLLSEIEDVPEPFLDEVLDFVHFLKAKTAKERVELMITSESSLKKDWLRPEEEEAWQNL